MKPTLIISLLLFTLSAGDLMAGEIRDIELKDGSIIAGEVQSLAGGVYTIRTESLGTIRIEDSRVQAIRPRDQASPSRSPGIGSQTRALEERMRADEEIMNKIQSLKDDPAFQKVLEDPELLNAVNNGDVAALMADPRFLQLMQNPAVQDIQKKMAK
ncbi:MAG: hypothetical protein ACYC7L_02040 [Nitrospirota bacterium]